MSAIIYWQNSCKLPMCFRCIKAFMHAFSGRFSRTCLEGISFNFLYVLSSIDQQEVRQKKTISNVIPEMKQNLSLLQISSQLIFNKLGGLEYQYLSCFRDFTSKFIGLPALSGGSKVCESFVCLWMFSLAGLGWPVQSPRQRGKTKTKDKKTK